MKKVVPYVVKTDLLKKGERLVVTNQMVKTKKRMTFTANIDSLGGGKLFVCHEYMLTNASWLEISDTAVSAYSYFSYANPQKQDLLRGEVEHGLKISGFITVTVDYEPTELAASVRITTASGTFSTKARGWYGHDGDVFSFFDSTDAKNCVMNWTSDDFARKIWVIGDSYLGFGHAARWPYYLFQDGYSNFLLLGFPGMGAERGLDAFKKIIDKGEPEMVFWTLGMNNMDNEGEGVESVNPGYLKATEEFIAICNERGIEPILSTVPNVPARSNRAKNAWVRSLPYRYVDFSHAVNADTDPSWYPDMLSGDNVHPAAGGAAALYSRVLVDFPEIAAEDFG